MGRTLEEDGSSWPWQAASRKVAASGFRWHVQVMGSGPVLLLLHGTGSSAHSWHRLVPQLSERFTLVIPDLPGHAFTESPGEARLTLPGMAAAVSDLMRALAFAPDLIAGHSAGAAIAVRAAIDGRLAPRTIVSINGALLPMGGIAGGLFAPLAKLLVTQPWVPRLLAWRAQSRHTVEKLLRDTGSRLTPEDVDYYTRLFRDPGHVAATLAMMANWDLAALDDALDRLTVPLVLIAADGDKAVPAEDAARVARRVPKASVILLPELGHLAHEERPEAVAPLIERAALDANVLQRETRRQQ